MLIFLDFDGVLHSAHAFRAEQMFSQLSVFEPFFRQPEFADIQFVVSSTWRHNRSLEELRAPFSADFHARIVGKTPEYVATSPIAEREQEILCYLEDHLCEHEPWLLHRRHGFDATRFARFGRVHPPAEKAACTLIIGNVQAA